ncbi:MAG: acetyl-CoA carboxylase biotin carboxyl carrier protein [Saprospiraceae bacterium]|nr:acetyl-CoA carboxylase biotin carboxyl carrier protein [Saprospiraceae bacterium]
MNFKEIQELIRMVGKSDLSFFRVKDKDFELTIKTNKFGYPVVQQPIAQVQMPSVIPMTQSSNVISSAAPASSAQPAESKAVSEKAYIEVKSPMVGTFYRSAGPDKPAFVKVGDKIDQGTTVCIIEAMKLFNEIESESKGTIVKILVEDSAPVEFDQVLFLLEP